STRRQSRSTASPWGSAARSRARRRSWSRAAGSPARNRRASPGSSCRRSAPSRRRRCRWGRRGVMIGIYEPLYRPDQELQEPAFLPLHAENHRAEWRELQFFVDLFRRGAHRQHALTGVFSPRFRMKAQITGAEFISHIAANPGADVYTINAPAHLPYFSYNVWMEGNWHHPGLSVRAQELLDACSIPWQI